MRKLRRINIVPLLKEAAFKWNADNCVRLGASLSYYTIFSLFPLILVTLAVIRILFNNSDAAREAILNALASVTGGFRDDFVTTLQAAQNTRRAAGIFGTITLVLGASWVFGELVSAFNIIWGLEAPSRGGPLQFLRATFFSFALVLAGIFLLLVSMIISAVLAALGTLFTNLPGGNILWGVVHTGVNLVVLTLVFALLLKFLPQTYVAWRDVWLGALLTAVLWTILQFGIAYYIAFSSYQNYGAVGSILALIAWVYLSSQVLFLGGEFTTVYARRVGSRSQPEHAVGAVPHLPAVASPNLPATIPSRLVNAGTGVTLGVLGVIGVTTIALLVGASKALRRLLGR